MMCTPVYNNVHSVSEYWLWLMSNGVLLCSHSFEDDHYVEFSKLCQDRVIGTKDQIAHVSILLPVCLCIIYSILSVICNGYLKDY